MVDGAELVSHDAGKVAGVEGHQVLHLEHRLAHTHLPELAGGGEAVLGGERGVREGGRRG